MKIGRNDPCWCGSGRKYKTCHFVMDERLKQMQSAEVFIPHHDMIKNGTQIAGIREAGKVNTEILDRISEKVCEGISTEELNRFAHEYTIGLGGMPAPLNFEGYPKSICTSVDEVVCHGIPNEKQILCSGDILNIDITTIYRGYYADASRMYLIGDVSEEKRKLVRVTKEALELAAQAAKPWAYLGDIGYAIQSHCGKNGYSVVREIGGHGVGLGFHEEPWVSHIGKPKTDYVLVPGMVFTIEPMVNMGHAEVTTDKEDGWTVRTADGKPSAQWEYTILITNEGNQIMAR